jgi:hypothetical protein
MNKELIEKVSAIREDLLALQAQVTDAKKLADLVKQKVPMADLERNVPPMWRNYQELFPYMTPDQKSRAIWTFAIGFSADSLTGRANVVDTVTRMVPRMLADLDDIAEKLKAKIT